MVVYSSGLNASAGVLVTKEGTMDFVDTKVVVELSVSFARPRQTMIVRDSRLSRLSEGLQRDQT